MNFIDIHCHLNLSDFDADRNEAIVRAREKGVGMIVVGVDRASSELAIKIAEEHSDVWAVIGLHPADNVDEVFDEEAYQKMAQHPRVVGIGECGFDYYHRSYDTKALQQEIFEKQIAIANGANKPLMLHLRNGKEGNAYKDALEVLANKARVKGDVHFFAGSWQDAQEFIELGFNLSFTGVITFTKDYDEVIRNAPLDMIMSETDAPFVTPASNRGKRNEPAFVVEVARKIAEIRGEPLEKVLPQLVENARTLFKL